MYQNAASLILATTNTDAEALGRITGQFVAFVALLAGVLKCWSISRRPTTNAKCTLGLMFSLLAMMVSSSFTILSRFLSFPPARTAAMAAAGLGLLGCIVAGAVLAIIGLVEIAKKPGGFVQGRAQAIWSLVLTGGFAVIIVISVLGGVIRASQSTFFTSSRPGQVLRFDELNFTFRVPERPWVQFNIAKINKDAKLGFTRGVPSIQFMIIAESPGGDFSCDQLAEIGKAHLESTARSARILRESPIQMNGLSGLLVETEASVGGFAFFYQHRYIATNGFAYQLIGYGRSADRARVSEEMAKLCSRFELIDWGRIGVAVGESYPTNFVSIDYDYWVNVTNSNWGPDASLEKEFPEAEFVASSANDGVAVVPVWFGNERPDLESLTAGLLATINIDYPDEGLRNRKEYEAAGLEGVQYDYETDIEQERVRYRLGILRGSDVGYLVAAWTRRTNAESVFADAFGRVHFHPASMRLLSTARRFSGRELKTQAFVLNQAGLFHYRSRAYNRALPLFRAAIGANPQETYLENALRCWHYLEQPREALDFLASQPGKVGSTPAVRAWQAYLQSEASLAGQAITNYAALFAAGYRDELHFSRYVNLLNGQQRFGESLAAIEAFLKKEDLVWVRLLEAEVYRLKGDHREAIRLLKQQRERAPFNEQVSLELVETSLVAELYADALELTREMATRNRSSAYVLYLRGKSELGLKWYREARNSFEAAAKLSPADKTISSYLEHVRGLIGEGDNNAVRERIDPVEFPPGWTNSPVQPAPENYARSYGAFFLQHIVAVSWDPGKERKTTEYLHAQVLDSAGVAAFSTLQRPFDPLGEQLYVNQLRVLDSAGNTISEGKLADYYVLDEPSLDRASHKKVLNIPVPGLQPGCQLIASITRRELGKLEKFPFFEHVFSKGFPVREGLVFLSGPREGLICRESKVRAPEELAGGLCWRCSEAPVVRYEPLQPPFTTFSPTLWIADGSVGWAKLVTNYLSSIADRLEPEPVVTEQSRKLVAGLSPAEARLRTLTAYVQTNYTYKALEFGRRAWAPNRSADVIRSKYGDCKDHALLLRQLLNAADIPAWLALVNHNAPVQKDLPSLDQFDHMVVFAPGEKGLFIDATDKGSDCVGGSPVGLGGRDALILDPARPRFVSIPTPAESESVLEIRRRLRLGDQETLSAEETLVAKGVQGSCLRDYLLQISPSSRGTVFQRYMGLEAFELSDFKAEGLETPGAPLLLHCTYTGKKQFHRSNERISGALQAGIERTYLVPGPVDKRLSPFELRAPLAVSTMVTFEIPDGFAFEPPRNVTAQFNSRFATCTNHCQVSGRYLEVRFECRRPTGAYAASEYSEYRDTMLRTLAALEKEIIFVRSNK